MGILKKLFGSSREKRSPTIRNRVNQNPSDVERNFLSIGNPVSTEWQKGKANPTAEKPFLLERPDGVYIGFFCPICKYPNSVYYRRSKIGPKSPDKMRPVRSAGTAMCTRCKMCTGKMGE